MEERAAARKGDLPIHDLRHTTRMFEAGYELRQVSAVMGWSASQEVRMARIFFHFTVKKNRTAVDAIDVRSTGAPNGAAGINN